MSKASETKKFVIERAAPVFNKKGYSGTSLSDLELVTGLTKGSIYGNFESKNELALEVFRYNLACMNKEISEFIRLKDNALDKLFGLTQYYRVHWKKLFTDGGCPIQNASVEADDNLEFMRRTVQDGIKAWVDGISRTIVLGQKKGILKKDIDAKGYAYAIITQLEGALMLSKIMGKHKILFAALDRIDDIIIKEIKK